MKPSKKISFIGGFVAVGLLAIFDIPFERDCIITFLVAIIYGVAIGVCAGMED